MKTNYGKLFYEKTTCVQNQMLDFQYHHKKAYKISRIECSILYFLMTQKEPVPFKEITKFTNVSNTRITHLTDSLVQKKLINRIDSPKDRRVLLATLTPEGKEIAQKFHQKQIKVFEEILKQLPENEQQTLFQNLQKWKDFLLTQVKNKG